MSRFKFDLDGTMVYTMIFDNHDKLWLNFHVTKHIINDDKNEGFDNVIAIYANELDEIGNKQIKNYNCKVEQESSLEHTCKKCDYVEKCSALIEKLSKSYLNVIVKGIKNDYTKPTHAHYERKRTQNSSKMSENILFIDEFGCSIICRKGNKGYEVYTCFRNAEFSNLNDIELSCKKLLSDFEWTRIINIKQWNSRLDGKKYYNVTKHIPENW